MKVLVIDAIGASVDFCMRCEEYGHDVKLFIKRNKEGQWPKIGDGIVEKVREWRSWMEWADLIFLTDNACFLEELEPYRKRGFPIFGPSVAAAELELDRSFGQKFLSEHGIETIPSEEFTNYDKAEKFVLENMRRYVSKPSGDADKALSYVSKSPADMVFMLRRWKETNKIKAPFLLQEFKPGIEVAVGGWIGPGGFSKYWCENFEHKKLMCGELGAQTGEVGTVLKYVESSALADVLLRPLEQSLIDLGCVGYIDLNNIVDDEGNIWPLEFTAGRPGWPTFNIQAALHQGDPVQWMLDLVEGRDTLECSEETATGVVMAIPDFPYSQYTQKELTGYPIYHTDEVDPNCLRLCEVMMGNAPVMDGDEVKNAAVYVSAGDYILVAIGTGETVSESSDLAYENIEKIELPNSPFYRIDVGDRLRKQLPQLQKMGFCEGWEYG